MLIDSDEIVSVNECILNLIICSNDSCLRIPDESQSYDSVTKSWTKIGIKDD